MSDGSLFVDIIPDFGTLKKKAKGLNIEAGAGSDGSGKEIASNTRQNVNLQRGVLGALGKIGATIFAIGKILEVFKPVIDVIGAIMKTLGLLLIPIVRLLLVLLTPVLKWLASFVSDFLSDPFGAVLRGIRDIFTQLLPDLMLGIGNAVSGAIESVLPSFVTEGLGVSGRDVSGGLFTPSGGSAFGGGGLAGMFAGNLLNDVARRAADAVVGRLGEREAVVNVEGVTDEATVNRIVNLFRRGSALFGKY